MPLHKASVQQHKTLEEFYGELKASTDSVSSSGGQTMLELLPLLGDLCADVEAWGLTSHSRLWLLAADSSQAPWLVSIQPFPGQGFQISYRMPATEAPWADAFVEGFATDEADAIRMVRIAMERSKGWFS